MSWEIQNQKDTRKHYSSVPNVGKSIYSSFILFSIGLVFVVIAFGYRIWSFKVSAFDGDEYAFALVARDVLHGKLPNAGVFDNKPVGLTYLFALSERLCGQTVFAIRALGFVASAACSVVLLGSSRSLGLNRGASLLIVSLFLFETLCSGAFASMSELLACPFLAAANCLLLKEKRDPLTLLGLGAAFGFACQITYLAAPCVVLTLVGYLFFGAAPLFRNRLQDCILIGLGCGVAASMVWIPQLISGDWAAYLADQFRYHQGYRQSAFRWNDWIRGFAFPLAVLVLPTAILVLLRVRQGFPAKALPRPFGIMALQMLGATLSAAASNRFYPHYLILALPAASVTAAVLLADTTGWRRKAGWLTLAAISMMGAAFSFVLLQSRLNTLSLETAAAAVVDRLTQPGQSIFVFNEGPTVYYLAERSTVGRYIFPSHYIFTCNHMATIAASGPVLADALAKRPALVLVGAMCPPEIDAEARVQKAGYRIVDTLEIGGRKILFNAPAMTRGGGGLSN